VPADTPLVTGALDPDAVLPYGRPSVMRTVVAEPVTALLIQRALVMEVAHPKVAAAVEDHSAYRTKPNRRAWATADAAVRLVFGDAETARHAARHIYAVHDHINGDVDGAHVSAGTRHGAGAPDATGAADSYSAHDATLLTWVWATLVDTAEVAYTRWVRPFTDHEATTYYAEMVGFGRFFGIPADLLPPDRAAFAAYLDGMLDGGFEITAHSRQVARQILWFRHRLVPPPAVHVERVLALLTLDPRLLERLDLHLSAGDRRLARHLDDWLTAYYRRLPAARRWGPEIYVRLRRPTIGLWDRRS
jgi:uncharacterized protein (DUF2236 family)